jgi:hypothetical protein
MLDSKARVWMTSKIRQTQPAWCTDNTNKFAAWFPLRGSGRQASYYDPKTKTFQLIDTCYSTHHLQFDNDANETVYFNELSGPMFGWIDTKVYDQALKDTKDQVKAEQQASAGADRSSTPTATARSPHHRGTSSAGAAAIRFSMPATRRAPGAGRSRPERAVPIPCSTRSSATASTPSSRARWTIRYGASRSATRDT